MADKKTFKISELSQIQSIDDNDLLLVSDYDNGACYSRKMTIAQLVQKVVQAVVSNQQVMQKIEKAAADAVAENVMPEKVLDIIQTNAKDVLDTLDGVQDNQFIVDGN